MRVKPEMLSDENTALAADCMSHAFDCSSFLLQTLQFGMFDILNADMLCGICAQLKRIQVYVAILFTAARTLVFLFSEGVIQSEYSIRRKRF